MAKRTMKLACSAALVLLGMGGYFAYSVFAAQGRPDTPLAQAPLNAQVQVPPAFIMAIDDSGSMDSEILVPTNDGAAWWHTGNHSFAGLDGDDAASPGVLNFNRDGAANGTWKKYVYLFPNGHSGAAGDGRVYNDAGNDHYAVPPIPTFAWARSPDVNKAYFEPTETYLPWVEADGSYLQGVAGIDPDTGQVDINSAPADPARGSRRMDLTADITTTGGNQRFMFYRNMVIPQGTHYSYAAGNCSNGGSVNTGGDSSTGGFLVASQDRTVAGTGENSRCGIGIRYFPATFHIVASRALDVASEIEYAATPIDDGATTPDGNELRRFEIRPDNFGSRGSYDAAIENFANYFTYYRKRHLGVRAGLSIAFDNQDLNLRAAYFKINQHASATVQMQRMNDPAERAQLYDRILNHSGDGGTPNREAVRRIGEQFKRAYSRGTSPVQLSCQKNYGMLFTDGFSNNWTGAGVGNVDNNNDSIFPPPLRDVASNTMADIAAHYYLGFTVSGLPDGGPVPTGSTCGSDNPNPRDDCQTDPHMNLYGVTLGAQGAIYGRPEFQGENEDPFANPPTWPTVFPDRNPAAVDDLWHATLNSRGRLVNASTPAALVTALEGVLGGVLAGAAPSGSVAISGARIGAGSIAVTPGYDGTNWSSTLRADRVSVDALTREARFENIWEASAAMPASDSRSVFFAKDGTVNSFSAATPASALSLADLCSNGLAYCTQADIEGLGINRTQAIDYLLGDDSQEILQGGNLRNRASALGDIVNSTPVVSAPTDDYGYRFLGGDGSGVDLGTSYAGYLELKRSVTEQRRYMVYVGANDGMLHAFDGGMTAAMAEDNVVDANGGREKFGYIPESSLGHMGNLLFPKTPLPQDVPLFRHRYFVDGPVTVSDARFAGGYSNGWSTVLVGTSGAGGRSVFALDVSVASRQTGSFQAAHRLWEVSDLDADTDISQNIGHVLGRPVIVPVKSNAGDVAWKAIFGNGYNSENGNAVLFIVDIGTGAVRTIEAVESGSGVPPGSNGLGNIAVLDRWRDGVEPDSELDVAGRDGFADTVYAGDQKGALWKFDLRDPSTTSVSVPLFVTRSATDPQGLFRQPIMGGIAAAAGPGGGTMLYFGTGSFSFEGDQLGTTMQSLYAVNDIEQGLPTARLSRSNLDGRIVSAVASQRTLDLGDLATGNQRGWYVDLIAGERFVGFPSIAAGVVFMPTYRPDPDAGGCSVGGANWVFGLNARTGAAALGNVSSSPGGGLSYRDDAAAVELVDAATGDSISAPIRDLAVQVVPRLGPGIPADPSDPGAPPDPPGGPSCWMLISAPGADAMYLPYPCGRQSWRQIQ